MSTSHPHTQEGHPAQAVVEAARALHRAGISNDKQQADAATRNLLQAYETYNRATAPIGAEAAGPVDPGTALNRALLDAQVAAVLAQAAVVTGEVAPQGARDLGGPESAAAPPANDLLTAADALSRSLVAPATTRSLEAEAAAAPSPDLDTAKANLRTQVGAFYDALMKKTTDVETATFKQITGLTPDEIQNALVKAGGPGGGLISGAFNMVGRVVNTLRKLLGASTVGDIQGRVTKTVDEVGAGGPALQTFLQSSYQSAAGAQTLGALGDAATDLARLDAATAAVAALQTRMDGTYGTIGSILGALQLVEGPLKLVGTTLFAGPVLIAMDVALLLGMDYADTTQLVRVVRGVVETTKSTLAA